MAQQAAGQAPHLPLSAVTWGYWPTIISFGLMVISIVATLLIVLLFDLGSPVFEFVPLGVTLAAVFLFMTLYLGYNASFGGNYFRRETPEQAAKAFLGALCGKSYLLAYQCLLDADKDHSTRLRPAVPKFGVEEEEFTFGDFKGFRNYWKGLLHKDRFTMAFLREVKFVRRWGDLAEVRASIEMYRHSTTALMIVLVPAVLLIPLSDLRDLVLLDLSKKLCLFAVVVGLVFGKRMRLPVKKLFRQMNGQWYAVNGELNSEEDESGLDGLACEGGRGAKEKE